MENYIKGQVLGVGTFGEVWKATHKQVSGSCNHVCQKPASAGTAWIVAGVHGSATGCFHGCMAACRAMRGSTPSAAVSTSISCGSLEQPPSLSCILLLSALTAADWPGAGGEKDQDWRRQGGMKGVGIVGIGDAEES